jgi:hypothetical protein
MIYSKFLMLMKWGGTASTCLLTHIVQYFCEGEVFCFWFQSLKRQAYAAVPMVKKIKATASLSEREPMCTYE